MAQAAAAGAGVRTGSDFGQSSMAKVSKDSLELCVAIVRGDLS